MFKSLIFKLIKNNLNIIKMQKFFCIKNYFRKFSSLNINLKPTINVWVTWAAGRIAHSFIPMIASGDVFGQNQPLNINLFDINSH